MTQSSYRHSTLALWHTWPSLTWGPFNFHGCSIFESYLMRKLLMCLVLMKFDGPKRDHSLGTLLKSPWKITGWVGKETEAVLQINEMGLTVWGRKGRKTHINGEKRRKIKNGTQLNWDRGGESHRYIKPFLLKWVLFVAISWWINGLP